MFGERKRERGKESSYIVLAESNSNER
jgi:hypothetical protein